MSWLIAGIMIASIAASLYLRSKLSVADSKLTAQGPTAGEGIAIPVVFGTRQITNPNVCWYGNQRDTKSDTVHYYALDAQIVLCHGQLDKLIDIVVNSKRTMWRNTGNAANRTDPVTVDGTIVQAGQIGGHPDSSKFSMSATVHLGALNTTTVDNGVADELATAMGLSVGPRYHGVAWLFAKCSLGTSPMFSPVECIVQRIHRRLGSVAQWYDEKAEIASGRSLSDVWKYKLQAASDDSDWSGVSYDDSAWGEAAGPISNAPAVANLFDYDDYPLPLVKTQLPEDGAQILDGGTFYYGNKFSGGKVQEGCKLWLRWTFGALPPINLFAQLWHDDSAKLFFNGTEITVKPTSIDSLPKNSDFNSTAEIDASLVNPSGPNVIAMRVLDSYASVFGSFAKGARKGSSRLIYAGLQLGHDTSVPGKLVDMNPAHIIHEVLTDPLWGMGYNEADLDDASFRAAADTLYDEQFGLSFEWSQQSTIEDFISEVLRHISGVLYVDRVTGLFTLKLIRADYTVGSLLELNAAHIVKLDDVSRKAVGELVNSVTVTYSATPRGDQGSLTIFEEGLLQIQGGVVSSKIGYPGVTNSFIAGNLALRDLRALSAPLLSCTVYASRHAAELNIGYAFVLHWADLFIDHVVMRVLEIDIGDGIDNQVKLVCIEDAFYYDSQRVTATNAPIGFAPVVLGVLAAQDTYHTCQVIDSRNKGQALCAFHAASWGEGTVFGGFEEVSPGVMRRTSTGPLSADMFDGVDPDIYNTTGVSFLIGKRVFPLANAGELGGGKRYSGPYIIDDVGGHYENYGTPQQTFVATYAQMHRDPAFSTSAQFTAQATFQMQFGTTYGEDFFQLTTTGVVLGQVELDWDVIAGPSFTWDQGHFLLKASQLSSKSIPAIELDLETTAVSGTHDFDTAFPTLAGTPGARLIPSGPWLFSPEAAWLDPTMPGDVGSITTLGFKVYRDRGDIGEVLFEVLSAQITATAPSVVPSIKYTGPQYLLDASDQLVLIPTIHTDSTTPVKLWFRYNSPSLGTTVKLPVALASDPTIAPVPPSPVVTPASVMSLDGPTKYTILGTSGNRTTAIGFPEGSTMGASLLVQIPQEAANGAMHLRPVWVPSTSGAAEVAVRWKATVSVVGAGSILDAGVSTLSSSFGPFVANVPLTDVGLVVAAPSAGSWVRITIQRLGLDALDTYTGQANLIGLQIDY